MTSHEPKLIWITGISGAGKSTIGKLLHERLKRKIPNMVYFDGDQIREIFGNDLGFTLEDRDKNAHRITRLCRFFISQGISVVCAANLTSQEYRDWCRKNIPGYFEVVLNVPIETLAKRDIKNLYTEALAGKKSNVVGVDIPYVSPANPDLVIDNAETREDFQPILELIEEKAF